MARLRAAVTAKSENRIRGLAREVTRVFSERRNTPFEFRSSGFLWISRMRISEFRINAVVFWSAFLSLLGCGPALAAPSFQRSGNLLVMSNCDVQVQYNLNSGTAACLWQNSQKISAFYAGIGLNSGYITGNNFSNRTWAVVSSNAVSVTAYAAGLPAMTQYFTLDQNDSFLTSVSVSGTNVSANWMGPVVVSTTGGVDLGVYNDNRVLYVPFDNDDFYSYNAMPMNNADTSYEVSAFYDNTTRHGMVVGSVTHDTWKSGVWFSGSNNKLDQMHINGGVTSPWDVQPHGFVTGNVISSPTVFVGFGADWRITLQNFAAENTKFAPGLVWTNGVPFGWNSWGVTNYQSHITYADAIAVSDSIHTNLQAYGYTNNGTVYVNLDSYGTYNLTSSQLQGFVMHCHGNGQKAGIYFTPFTYWGTVSQGSNSTAPGSAYHWSDCYLRTTSEIPISYDGAIALDPTHPGTKDWIYHQITNFISSGFDYVKIDFLSHGALEGVHWNTNATTGIEAYNEGMQLLLNEVGGAMFISESIAPLFPYQYGDGRRIACDAYTSFISNTAYTMNSVTYGWWLDKLYPFNDPDLMVFDNGPDTNEDQSRLINCAITGVFLNGSSLTNAASISLAQMCLTNAAINTVARVGQTFMPVEGNTGTSAANVFTRQDGLTWCIAVFNYTSGATNETVTLSRAGLPAGTFVATNLWDGTSQSVSNSFNVSLNAKQAKLFRLTPQVQSPPVIAYTIISGGNLIFGGSNGVASNTYHVVAATNLSIPWSNWTMLSTGSFNASGAFAVTNPINSGRRQLFYLLAP